MGGGRAHARGAPAAARPLLFYRGAYSTTEEAEPTPGIMDNLITWSRHDDWF
jgi:3-hydroxy-9,10-secoandrosta-1,3,5(10)-triene-9,17-dione monooxygenase reductase component